MMDRSRLVALTLLLSIGLDALARETVLDEVVHVQDIVLDVPEVARLDAGLDLNTKRVDVGGASLYVEEEGSGVPLVLINGGPGGTHHYFHPWFSRASEYARVIYYDQRGTGLSDSEPGAEGYSVEQAVEDLDRMREALGISTWVLLGYSYGGFLAQYYATTHPEHVAGLVLLGASPGLWVELGDSRQHDYLSDVEIDRIRSVQKQIIEMGEENDWPRDQLIRTVIFNNFINGDWKRQHFYRPTPAEIALTARYEWVNERGFNGTMNRSANRVNLAGAFDRSPFQTLILEGKWDLTWGEEKPAILAGNHPRARFVMIDNAGHGIFNENPEQKYYVNITGGTKLTAAAAAVAAFIIGAESYYVLNSDEINPGDNPIVQLDLPRISPLSPIKGIQLDILKFLVDMGGSSDTPEICDALDTTGKALHHHINKLERFRLITRKESHNDRRVKVISITNAGRVVAKYSIF